ncbi:murein transglycosylase A [Flavisphingomonas formosensis]|uniref:murein transglycosylase A n=1 Tax=Flavisphingomonas formosensis TaxID=861534 RepID=UPI0012FC70A2|nr:murein transglycosylase A [Sphingomonas formosensis]
MTALRYAALGAALFLSACGVVPSTPESAGSRAPSAPKLPIIVPDTIPAPAHGPSTAPLPQTPAASGANARGAGVQPGPAVASLPITADGARAALGAFRLSCPALVKRTDGSGLTIPSDWAPACNAAVSWPDSDARSFFARYFETAVVGTGSAYATGYYEPEILGSRSRSSGFTVPIYRRPPDLIDVDLGLFAPDLKGKRIRGRVSANTLIPYHDRTAIDGGALAGQGLEIAWAADPIEFFFLQVQGSGRLRLPDGTIMRIGYDGQNGRDYVGIGKWMKDRGMLASGSATMQGVMARLRQEPDGGISIMQQNKSFVFFKEIVGPGPLGALGVPVTGRVSVAADPAYIPLGAPVWLEMDRSEATGLWVAQDTGGAIKGANRIDTFWGAGDNARTVAGGMSSRGQATILLPIGSVARARGGSGGGAAARP